MLTRQVQDRIMRDVDDLRTRVAKLEATHRACADRPFVGVSADDMSPKIGGVIAAVASISDAVDVAVANARDVARRLLALEQRTVRPPEAPTTPLPLFTITTSPRVSLSEVEPLGERPIPVDRGSVLGEGAWVVYTSRSGSLSSNLITDIHVESVAVLTNMRVNGDDWTATFTPCPTERKQSYVPFRCPGRVSDGDLLTLSITSEDGRVYYAFVRVRTVMKSLMNVYCAHVAHLSSRQDTLVISLGTPVAIVGLPGDSTSNSEAKYHNVECWFINDEPGSVVKLDLRTEDGVVMYTPPRAGSYRFCATSGNGSTDTLALRKHHLQRIVVIDESIETDPSEVN